PISYRGNVSCALATGGMSMKIRIGSAAIGGGEPCFLIAEAGVNHEGDMEVAKRMIREAVEAGRVRWETIRLDF
ncbi:MAG: hypothetical protein ACP6IT_07505, partial [Candidatus Thorarchaeota archaeon]